MSVNKIGSALIVLLHCLACTYVLWRLIPPWADGHGTQKTFYWTLSEQSGRYDLPPSSGVLEVYGPYLTAALVLAILGSYVSPWLANRITHFARRPVLGSVIVATILYLAASGALDIGVRLRIWYGPRIYSDPTSLILLLQVLFAFALFTALSTIVQRWNHRGVHG